MKELKLIIRDRAFNKQFKGVWQSRADFIVLYGGGGSGKSEMAADKILFRTLLEKNHRIVNFRKVGKTIRISQWLLLRDKIKRYGMEKLFDMNKTEMSMTCKVNGNQILSIGMDDREKIKSLVEPTSFWVNEATEFDKEDFQQLIMRLRGHSENYKQIILDFNPIDEYHWLKDWFFPPDIQDKVNNKGFAEYIKKVEIDGKEVSVVSHIWHSTWRDNKFLHESDKAKYEMMKDIDPNYYNIYAKGIWGKVGNLVYPNGFIIIDKSEYPKEFDEVIYGLDFGFTNPTALVKIGLKYIDTEKGRYIEAYEEELLYEEKLTGNDLVDRMSDLDIDRNDPIYVDDSDPVKVNALMGFVRNDYGRAFCVLSADKNVKAGLDFVRGVKRYSCPENVNLNKEIASYRWRTDARGLPIDGEPIKYNDHLMDAERYALYTHHNLPELKMAFI